MAKLASKGTTLQLEISSTLTSIAQQISIDGPSEAVELIETPTLDQAARAKPWSDTGFNTLGQVSAEIYSDPQNDTTHQEMLALLATPADTNWAIELSDGQSLPFTGYLQEFGGFSAADGQLVTSSVTVQPTAGIAYPAPGP